MRLCSQRGQEQGRREGLWDRGGLTSFLPLDMSALENQAMVKDTQLCHLPTVWRAQHTACMWKMRQRGSVCGGHTWLLTHGHRSRLAAAGGGCGDGRPQDAPPVAVASSEARPGVPILSSGCSQRKEEAGTGAGHCFRDIRAPVGTVCLLARLPVPPWIHCLLHSRAPQGLPRLEPCWGCAHKNQQTRDFMGQVVGEGTDPF